MKKYSQQKACLELALKKKHSTKPLINPTLLMMFKAGVECCVCCYQGFDTQLFLFLSSHDFTSDSLGKTGKGMDVDPQMLGDASKTVLLRAYFHRGYKYDVIVQMLQQYHGK